MRENIFQSLLDGSGDFNIGENDSLTEWDLKVVVATLLYSVVQSDQKVAQEELAKLREILGENYQLASDEVEDLIKMGSALYQSNEVFERFCEVLKEVFSEVQREKVYAFGWKLICTDNVIEESERVFAENLRQKLGITSERASEIEELIVRISQIS